MAVIKAFRSVFHSRPTDTYRLTIYDLAGDDTASNNNALYGYDASASTDPVDIDVAFDSLVQTWDGAIDTVHTPIIGSRLEMGLHLTNDTHYLLDLIKARKEGEIAVKLERHDGLSTDVTTDSRYDDIFIGCLSPEAVTYPFQNPPFELSLVFTDGLSLLRDFAYEQDDGTPWTDDATHEHFRTQIGRCLSKLPHLALYDQTVNAPFLVEQLDCYHFNQVSTILSQPYSVLDKSGCNQTVWYDTRLHDNPFNRKQKIVTAGSTCYEVIQDIMTALGGTFMVHNGSFWAVSPFMKDDNSVTNKNRAWKSDYRTLTDPSYQDSAATGYATSLPNRIDYTASDILLGSTRSFLNPAKSVMYTHAKGGAPYIFKEQLPVTAYGDIFAQNIFYPAPFDIDPTTPSYDSGFGGYGSIVEEEGKSFPLKNDDYTFVGGQELLIKARVVLDIGDGLGASDDAFVSAQPTIKMKIKVGDKYLKQTVAIAPASDFTLVNNFGRVHIAVGNPMNPVGTDQTGWRPLEITSDVEWTDTVGDRFEFPFLIEGQNDPEIDTIEYTDGEDIKSFPVGLQCVRHGSHASRMRFRWSDRKKEHDLIVNMVLPPLPGSASDTYTGIEIDVESKVWRNTDGSGTMQSVDFDNALVPYDSLRFHNLRVLAGEDVDDEDILYVAASDSEKGFEHVDGGSTLLGSRLDGYYGDVGMMKSNEPGHITDGSEVDGYGEYWFSEAESGRDPSSSDGRPSMEVIAHEHLAIRQELREVYNISLLAEDHHKEAIWPLRRIKIETGTTDAVVQVMSCAHQFSSGQYSFTGFEIARAGNGITDTTSDAAKQVNRKRPSRLPGPRPASKSAAVSGITNVVQDKLGAISYSGTGISGFNFGTNTNVVPAEQVETDQDRQFMSQVQIDQHLDNTECVSRIVRDAGTGNITSFTVQSGSKPLTSDQVNDASSSSKFTDADGVTKLGYITLGVGGISSITASNGDEVSLDIFEDVVDASRVGQTGVNVVTIDSDTQLQEVADGSAGQFLQTNGSGVLSWASASGGGWHGSATLIKVLPTEWTGNDVGRAITQVRIEDDTTNTLGVACNQASGSLFAINEIPTGYKATHVQVYTDVAVTSGVEVFSFNHTTGATTSVGTGNTNASIDITDITSGATASIVIEVSPGSTDRMIFGADITIAAV